MRNQIELVLDFPRKRNQKPWQLNAFTSMTHRHGFACLFGFVSIEIQGGHILHVIQNAHNLQPVSMHTAAINESTVKQ
jgi:hypothetical protein